MDGCVHSLSAMITRNSKLCDGKQTKTDVYCMHTSLYANVMTPNLYYNPIFYFVRSASAHFHSFLNLNCILFSYSFSSFYIRKQNTARARIKKRIEKQPTTK